ncbi:MAG: carboxylesterase family protein [Woeseiaceae bacterium]|nr:carboxylesterase family protein [Woeseiaceae bacterium]
MLTGPRTAGAIGGAVVLLALLGACSEAPPPAAPVVDLNGVEVTGRLATDDGVAAFLGLPFAAAPEGDLRWRPPLPVAISEPLEATAFAPACMQGTHIVDWYAGLIEDFGADPDAFPVPTFSEDCLYLNVWTPSLGKEEKLPVMVWIHGGAHRGGWAYEPNYLGDRLAAGGAVVVSIAYRLDVFGFFSHPALPRSNFGLLDQIAALGWIREHIDAFGGDPDNVTLFGESAGAASAGYLMASPKARGLFRRVIYQSAGYEFLHDDRRENFLDEGEALALRAADGSLESLRNAPPERILAAAREVYTEYQPDAVVDGDTLVEPPAESLRRGGRLKAVDLIAGTTADEWRMYLDAETSAADVDAWLDEHANGSDAVRALIAEDADPLRQLDRLITARQFVCPSLALANAMVDAGRGAWVYRFSRVRPGERSAAVGAYHGAEIPYVFDTHDDWLPTAAEDRELGHRIAGYWLRFATSGDPNGENATDWPAWVPRQAEIIDFGDTIERIEHPERELCRALAAAGALR